jgi:site-specific DNA-methyltransferase (adenine-specific)
VRDCVSCGDIPASGYRACQVCLLEVEENAFAAAAMLGQQSHNWHERATHSRGYADNDPVQFGRWCQLWSRECLRLLKPGGHLVAFGGTRTWHRAASAFEDSGFEIRDSLAWLYATGFPKSVPVSRAIAKHLARSGGDSAGQASSSAAAWEGWGTALKPAHEPIVVARKPLTGTVAANVLEHGVGALNIDLARTPEGRWPTNVYLDASQAQELDALDARASRFFWVAKPGGTERVRVGGVSHPTVKPLSLMRELIRLVTVPSAVVLDPFAGSGTTVEACVLEGRRASLSRKT